MRLICIIPSLPHGDTKVDKRSLLTKFLMRHIYQNFLSYEVGYGLSVTVDLTLNLNPIFNAQVSIEDTLLKLEPVKRKGLFRILLARLFRL